MENLNQMQDFGSKHGLQMHFDHGTTTLGFCFQGGVLLAVDSRATGGQFIGSGTMKKVVEINNYMLGTLAGGAADCVYWDRVLAKECRLYELRNKERISVAAASKIIANISHEYKGMGLSMGMMLAGYDKRGPGLYYVDSDAARITGKLFSVGSGSVYAYGVLDSGYRWDLTDEEAQGKLNKTPENEMIEKYSLCTSCSSFIYQFNSIYLSFSLIELGRRAIYHATHRDAYSGGIVRVYHIKPTGWVNISNEDSTELHYKYAAEKAARTA